MEADERLNVTVRVFTTLRELIGEKQLKLSFKKRLTLRELMTHLSEKYGKKFHNYVFNGEGEFRSYIQFFINGEQIKNSDIEHLTLKDGDVVAIIPPVSGGSI